MHVFYLLGQSSNVVQCIVAMLCLGWHASLLKQFKGDYRNKTVYSFPTALRSLAPLADTRQCVGEWGLIHETSYPSFPILCIFEIYIYVCMYTKLVQ
jgi:hypothetical protein